MEKTCEQGLECQVDYDREHRERSRDDNVCKHRDYFQEQQDSFLDVYVNKGTRMREEAGSLEKDHEDHRNNKRCFVYEDCHLFLCVTKMIMVDCSWFFGCSGKVLMVGTCVRKGLFTSWWPGSKERQNGAKASPLLQGHTSMF